MQLQFILNSLLNHERPAYRAARLVELLPAQAATEAIGALQRTVQNNDLADKVREIVHAVQQRAVLDLVEHTSYLTDDLRRDLMSECRTYSAPRVALL